MNRIYFIRERNNLTQEQFAKIFNIDRSLVSKWENEDCLPSIEKLNHISNYFQVSFDYIFYITADINYEAFKTDIDANIVGQRISKVRKINRLSLRQLAVELNTTPSTISAYENGKTILLVAFALQMCKKYNLSMDWLYGKID